MKFEETHTLQKTIDGEMTSTSTTRTGADVFKTKRDHLSYRGASHFRARLIFATLAQRAVKITDIRADDEQLGLRGSCFCRLVAF